MITNYNSPISSQPFIWFANYLDGNVTTEFDQETGAENSFYDIDKESLVRFGLVGMGMPLYYEVFGGAFKLAGQMLEFRYKVNNKEYYLTGQQYMYNDIITYKNAESTINTLETYGEAYDTQITQYNFGYKKNLSIDDVIFSFKPICIVPQGGMVYMKLWLVSDTDLNGVLQIKRNGKIVAQFSAPLTANVGGELNWMVE